MKYLFLLLFLIGCTYKIPYTGNSGTSTKQMYAEECGSPGEFKVMNIRCLYTRYITGGDPGGRWIVVIKPNGSTIDQRLIGSDPCINFANEACGKYRFNYIVGDPCCYDTAIVNVTRCCVTASVNCQ